MDTADLVRELCRPEAYARRAAEVGFLQTHTSLLFFVGERVYKVKKPVDLGFLDYSTLARREHFCREEVRLNRRLAPDVYLGVAAIVAAGQHLALVPEPANAPVIEWAVEMVRLPAARMLSAVLERGEIDNEPMRAIAALLADFHRAAPTGPDVDPHGAPEAVAANARENFAQTVPFVGALDDDAVGSRRALTPAQHAFLAARQRAFPAERRELLLRRVREGRVREGHGDLHAGNVCLTERGPIAYDCIEFERRFRCGDVACDLAFLAMDIDHRGFPAFARFLVREYASLADDRELEAVIGFYKTYRAIVRGKVACLRSVDAGLEPREREDARCEAMRYFQLALAYELPPALVLTCGLPATGKSWLARRLAGPLRAVVLQSDVRRKTLAGRSLAPTKGASRAAGLYSPERKRETYRSLLADAVATLEAGHGAIVDATFSSAAFRRPFVDAAVRLDLPYFVVHVRADEATVRERLAARARDPRSVSEADLAVYLSARETFEPPHEVPEGHVIDVDARDVPEHRSARVLERMIELAGR